jgi:hypothetical protein
MLVRLDQSSAHLVYSSAAMDEVTVTVEALHRDGVDLTYSFGGKSQVITSPERECLLELSLFARLLLIHIFF